jgi:hypothetical protein
MNTVITKQSNTQRDNLKEEGNSNARIRSADLDIVALRGDEDANQSLKTRRVNTVVVGDQDRGPVFHFFFYFEREREV